jgi:hypothetical protein
MPTCPEDCEYLDHDCDGSHCTLYHESLSRRGEECEQCEECYLFNSKAARECKE